MYSLNNRAIVEFSLEVYWNSTIKNLNPSPSIWRVVLNLNVELNYEMV